MVSRAAVGTNGDSTRTFESPLAVNILYESEIGDDKLQEYRILFDYDDDDNKVIGAWQDTDILCHLL